MPCQADCKELKSLVTPVQWCAVKFIWALGNNGSVRFWIQSCCKSRSLKRVICCQSEKESRPRLFRTLTPTKKNARASKVATRLAKTWHLPTHTVWRCVWKFGQKSISKMAGVGGVAGRAHYQGAREGTAGEARTGRRLLTQLLPSKVSLHYIWTDFNSFKPKCLDFSIVRPIKLHWIFFHRISNIY